MVPRRGSRATGPGVDYVIASTPRTGSGLLAAALAGTGVAGRPDPHLRPDRAGPWRPAWGIPGEPKGTIAMLAAARAATTTPNGVFGTKLHWYQMVNVVRELHRIDRAKHRRSSRAGAVGPDDMALLGQQLHHPRWIHVSRPDTAAQAISYYRVLYSGLWSLPSSAPGRPGLRPDRPDLRQVRWLEDMLVAHEAAWRDWFDRHGVTPLEITYDELDGDYPGTVTRVLDRLGVEAVVAPGRPLRRQDGAWSERWAKAYSARRDTLQPQPAGSAWADLDLLTPTRQAPVAPDPVVPEARRRVAVTGGSHAPQAQRLVPPPGPDDRPAGPSLRYSCVVDRAPIFLYQSLIWAQTLLTLAARDPGDIVAHLVEGVPDDHAQRLRSLGIEVVTIARDHRSGFANKLGQLTSGAFDDVDVVVLSDCDIAFSEDMGRLVPGDAIGGKVVDAGFPAYNVWVRLVRLAGMSDRVPLARATQTARWTSALNLNGGLLTVPRRHLPLLAEAWPRWLDWVLIQAGRFGSRVGYHAFQISLGLTIAELDLPVVTIPTQLNFSTLPPQTEIDGDDPIALHYHRRLRPDGLIERTGVAGTDRAIDAVNAVLRSKKTRRLVAPALASWRESLAAEAR